MTEDRSADAVKRAAIGKVLYHAGKYEQAAVELRQALSLDSGLLEAQILLGISQAKMGRLVLAEANLLAVLKSGAENCDALLWLAFVRKAQNRGDEALELCGQVVLLRPGDAAGHNMLGLCLLQSGDPGGAVEAFRQAVSLAPHSGPTFHNLGLACRRSGRMTEARDAFKRAVDLAPEQPDNYYELYMQFQILAEWDKAARHLEDGIRRHPKSLVLVLALANVYSKLRLTEKAEAAFKWAMELDPSSTQSYALWLQFEGRFEESVDVAKRSIALRANQGLSYFTLAEANCFEFEGDSLLNRALSVLRDADVDRESRMYLSYALGKAYDRETRYEMAMKHFDEGNALAYEIYNAVRGFDARTSEAYPDKVASIYSKDQLARLRELGKKSTKPLFIVGMIRSGTTLLDQIVTSHPMVEAAGELDYWKIQADQFNRRWFNNGIEPDEIGIIGNKYLSALDGISEQAACVTDKMPINYESLGLIHLVFPKARILHIRRNPVDTCLSIYMTFFGGGPNFAYKKEHVVAYYRAYLRFMENWRSLIPTENLFEIDYEALVGDTETTVKEIIDFCGLPWDASCLRHQRNRNSVATPSTWQARQPIYSTSVARWRKYEPWLGTFQELKGISHPQLDGFKERK